MMNSVTDCSYSRCQSARTAERRLHTEPPRSTDTTTKHVHDSKDDLQSKRWQPESNADPQRNEMSFESRSRSSRIIQVKTCNFVITPLFKKIFSSSSSSVVMVFLLRLRTPSSMQRLVFPDSLSTWHDLQLQIEDVVGVPLTSQQISRAPLHQPQFIQNRGDVTLKELKLQNGDILYLKQDANTPTVAPAPVVPSSTSSAAASSVIPATLPHIPPHKLTPRCQHGPRGACPYCMTASRTAPLVGRCQHGPNTTCIHCQKFIKDTADSTTPAAWLCNHPDTAFCPLCLPPAEVTEQKTPKVDVIPYKRFLQDKTALCKYKHGPTVTCAYCAPPPFPSFQQKRDCDKGHLPYPNGVCLSCAPPNATLRVQKYRHVDSVSLEARVIQPFYTSWVRSGTNKQRAAILFGRYIDEPAETNNPGAIRALALALYEPPQEGKANSITFTRDDREATVHAVASWLGMEPVGWIVATLPRSGDKYGGAVFMSGWEVTQAAAFQWRYRSSTGHSRFVSIVIEHSAQVEPRAYQVADMAVALQRDNAFALAEDPYMLTTRQPNKHEMVPTVVYKDRPLQPSEEFLPDELLVKVNLFSPKQGNTDSIFKHDEYPPAGSDVMLKQWNITYNQEEYEQRLADFGLLIALTRIVGENIVKNICQALKDKKMIDTATRADLDRIFIEKNLL